MQFLSQLKRQPDVIAITETKLRESHIYSNIDIEGFTVIHKDSASLAGGAGLYVKNSFKFNKCSNLNINTNEVETYGLKLRPLVDH